MAASGAKPFAGRVIFDHRQKTAGQAVNKWLLDALGRTGVTPNVFGRHSQLIRRFGGSHSVISGHVDFDEGEPHDARYQYVTLLRDPLDRALSWIYFCAHDVPRDSVNSDLIDGARRFVESEGRETTPWFLDTITDPYVRHFSRIGGPWRDAGGALPCALAISALESYQIVGLYEAMTDFVRNFAGLLGIPAPAALDRVNVTSKRAAVGDVPKALRARLGELHEGDAALYARVRELVRDGAWGRFEPPERSRWGPYERVVPWRTATTADAAIESVHLPFGALVERSGVAVFELLVDFRAVTSNLACGIHICDADRQHVFGTNTRLLGIPCDVPAPGRYKLCFTVSADFPIGLYTAGFAIHDHTVMGPREVAWHDALCTFEVRNNDRVPGSGHSPTSTVITVVRAGDRDAVANGPV